MNLAGVIVAQGDGHHRAGCRGSVELKAQSFTGSTLDQAERSIGDGHSRLCCTVGGDYFGAGAYAIDDGIVGGGGQGQQRGLVTILDVVFLSAQINGLGCIPVIRCEAECAWAVADLAGVVVAQCNHHVGVGLHTQRHFEAVTVTTLLDLVVTTTGGDDDARDIATVDHFDWHTDGPQPRVV